MQCTPSGESVTAKLLPGEPHSASQHQASIALNCVCEHLCSVSIYFMHPLARCVLRQLLLCFMPFRLTQGFIGILYFLIAGETCTGFWTPGSITGFPFWPLVISLPSCKAGTRIKCTIMSPKHFPFGGQDASDMRAKWIPLVHYRFYLFNLTKTYIKQNFARYCSKSFININSFNFITWIINWDLVLSPILQRKKLRHREVSFIV